MRDHLIFRINGQAVRAAGEDAWLMLSDFLRKRRGLTGTKVVCAEGDCGSCSVLVGRPRNGAMVYRSVASCIQQVCQLDGTHVVTVEGLSRRDELNPFQEAMVRCHGAQCGFCTPGFVVAMQEIFDRGDPIEDPAVRRGLSGNLCRCTGYDAIVRAALETDRGAMRCIDELYPPAELTAALSEAASESVMLWVGAAKCFKPATLEAATDFLGDAVAAGELPTVLSGGTDLGVLRNKGIARPNVLMYVGDLDALRGITLEGGALVVGAATPLSEFEAALATHLPELAEFLGWFGSPPIRHAGTLAGNLCTASPIGDTPPALYVLQAEIELASTRGRRRMLVQEFQSGYRTTVREPDELVVGVRVPLLVPDAHLRLYKVSRRKDLDISTVSAAFHFRAVSQGLADVRIALGGVGATVVRLPEVEALLEGQRATRERFEQAGASAAAWVSPMSDVRGSEVYRRTLCRNVFLKLWSEFEAGRFAADGQTHRKGV